MVNNFANRLKILINENKTKKKDLAEAIGLTPSAITNLVKEWSKPSTVTIKSIAAYYHVNPEWLEHGTGEIMATDNIQIIDVFRDMAKSGGVVAEQKTDYREDEGVMVIKGLTPSERMIVEELLKVPRERMADAVDALRALAKAGPKRT